MWKLGFERHTLLPAVSAGKPLVLDWKKASLTTLPPTPNVPGIMDTHRPKSKSGQLADLLRGRLLAGDWGESMPAERSLAEEFLVSRSTVRNALAILERESLVAPGDSTRMGRRILFPKSKRQRGHSGRLVVVLTPALSQSPLLLEQVAILRGMLSRSGVRVEVRDGAHLSELKKPEQALARFAAKTAGAVWVLHKMPHAVHLAAGSLGLPCIVFGSTGNGVDFPFIDVDFRAVAAHATGRCLAKGFSRIGVLVHRTPLAGDAVIVEEVTTQLERKGALPPLILRHDFNRARLIDALDQRIIFRTDRPQVLIIANQHHLLTTLTHLQRRGVNIPADLSLVYLGNDPVTERLSPLPDRYDLGIQLPRRLAKAAQAMLSGEMPSSCRLLPKMLPGETFNRAFLP